MFTVRSMHEEDLPVVSQLNKECFPGDNSTLSDAKEWISASWRAAPRTSYFVLEDEQGQVIGYILWLEKGGFRKEAVLELEQIGITSSWRGKRGATFLIRESLGAVKKLLENQGRKLKLVEVTTAADNETAKHLFCSTLGAEVEAIISGLYVEDEVIMVAREP